uniref:PABC domain-containing protein n=1 Tax=Phaeocystis antarctica TaxID=33657 RepID=A0A7S0HRS1_9EUKA
MPRNSQKPKTPVAPKKPYASAPLGAPLAVKINSPRSITKSASKHERFASAIHAPSPSCLPKPPSSWTRPAAPALHPAAQLTAPVTPPITLQRSDVVQKQLQGNLLFSMLEPRWPQLAGKITGMLLELDAEERDELFRLPEARERRIEEALAVLREAGDPRLVEHERVTACAPLTASNGLTVSVSAAAIDSFAGSMRMSPRLSSNPYATKSLILSPPASALAAVSLTGATGQ